MADSKELRALKLFVKKAAEIRASDFALSILNTPSGFNITFDQEIGLRATRHGPSLGEIKACVLTFRFFIQDNDGCSLRNITKHMSKLSSTALISAETLEEWTTARNQLNAFLDERSFFSETQEKDGVQVARRKYTKREIMDTFIYGDLAHANEEKEKRLDRWKRSSELMPVLENELVNCIGVFVRDLPVFERIVNRAIAEIDATATRAAPDEGNL